MTETVTKTIIGSCGEISEKNGWTTFHIDVGSQYPVKLSTKKDEIIAAGRAVGIDQATWTFKESDSDNINEKTGKPFVNRYLDKVEAGAHQVADGTTGVTPAPQRPPAGEHAPLAIGDKERSIMRMACLKAAADLFSGQGNTEVVGDGVRDNVSELLAAADRFERWVMRDLQELPF